MKKRIATLLALLTLGAAGTAQAAFTIGGENGWSLSTDGIVDIFATYTMTSRAPKNASGLNLLDNASTTAYNQRFGIGVGLLPSVVAFNVKAPTVNGVESTVRIGIYPSVQNGGNANLLGTVSPAGGGLSSPVLTGSDRFSVGPNIDFREIFYTAKGAYGELLAGRALNLYQGKNILTDMTLLTAGTVSFRANTVTLGHIGYGYLYTGFGPQFRYTTPDFGGAKFALEVGEPYALSSNTSKTNSPRVEAELSYAKKIGGVSVQGWLAGLYQNTVRKDSTVAAPVARGGKDNESIGGAYGLGAGFSGVNLLVSGYGGKGLGMLSAQDGKTTGLSVDESNGKERLFWGGLAQVTYQLTPSVMLGANYGRSQLEQGDGDVGAGQIKTQESGVATVTYNLNKFTQFVAEYIYAQNSWYNHEKQHSNQIALGSMFYW